jgi:hypothetical protein
MVMKELPDCGLFLGSISAFHLDENGEGLYTVMYTHKQRGRGL